MNLMQQAFTVHSADGGGTRYDRVSRRSFIAGAVGAVGIAANSGLWFPITARAEDAEPSGLVAPRPIPQTLAPGSPFHILPARPGVEPSTITDFHGKIGLAILDGTGTACTSASSEDLLHVSQVRFMRGKYVGVDNLRHTATVVFI